MSGVGEEVFCWGALAHSPASVLAYFVEQSDFTVIVEGERCGGDRKEMPTRIGRNRKCEKEETWK